MSHEEFEKYKQQMKEMTRENTKDKKTARESLRKSGIINNKGELTKNYRS